MRTLKEPKSNVKLSLTTHARVAAQYATLRQAMLGAGPERGRDRMSNADQIRKHARERYVLPARRSKQKRFSINAGDVVRELRIVGRAPAVCSALKTGRFLENNDLRIVDTDGPPSGQSTTVTYTYE